MKRYKSFLPVPGKIYRRGTGGFSQCIDQQKDNSGTITRMEFIIVH